MNATIPDNWYETFFTGINCEMWEKAATPEWTKAEVDFIKDVLQLPTGAKERLRFAATYGNLDAFS